MNDQPPIEGALAIVPHVEQNLPSDAKNKAISDLTAACYQKASQLQLSKEEIAALSADFPDEAFQAGAAGKENLIYIEHAALRERLDQVIGMGQWCVIPIRRWGEDFLYKRDIWANNRRTGQQEEVKGCHVYVDGIMLIRGAFVGSAIGEMTYYPDNHTQNYGDAVEGAETAALRRCCKRLGIGLQAWRKDWCLTWWDRRNSKGKKPVGRTEPPSPPQSTTPSPTTPPAPPASAAKAKIDPKVLNRYRLKALNNLQAAPGQRNEELVRHFAMSKGWITGTQELEHIPAEHVPTSPEQMAALLEEVSAFEGRSREVQP